MSKTALGEKKSSQDQILGVKTGQDFVFLLKRWCQASRQPRQSIFSRNVSWQLRDTEKGLTQSVHWYTFSPAWLHVGRYRGGSHPSCLLIYYIPSLWIFYWLRLRLDIHKRVSTPQLSRLLVVLSLAFPLQNLTSPVNQLPMRLLQGVLSGQGMKLNSLQLLSLNHQKLFVKFLSKTPRAKFLLSSVSYRNSDTPTLVVMSLLNEKKDHFMTT